MKKIILHGLGNEESFNYYIFDKRQKIAEEISKILYKIFKLNWDFFEEVSNKGVYIRKKRNIEKYKDSHESIVHANNESRFDVFYGDKKMFITINCSQDLRLKFNKELFKIAKMPKHKK